MRALIGALLLGVTVSVAADSYVHRKQIGVQVAKVHKMMKVDGAVLTTSNDDDVEAAAIAPNPYAHAPSAQCRFGWSVTGAVVPFGAGVSGSEWDRICGLWMAAQQTIGDAQTEAAAAAFCLTMKDAGVQSKVCATWADDQQAQVTMSDLPAGVIFSGAGSTTTFANPADR